MPPPRLHLVGLGLRPGQLTDEARAVLSGARRVLFTSYVPGTGDLLRGLCADVQDLSPLYEPGGDRLDTYKAMAATALTAALEHGSAALALYGHPLVLALPSMICLRVGPRLGVDVRVVPGLSALDSLTADLGVDLVATGVQMHEATDVLLYRRVLDPAIATVLWQVGAMGSRLHAGAARSLPARLEDLVRHLAGYFPADHPAVLATSAVVPDGAAEIRTTTVARLADAAPAVTVATTLYLPPVPGAPVDRAVADRLVSETYLASVTGPAAG